MSKVRIAINGFGRIGRLTLRSLLSREDSNIEIVGINDLTNNATLAHLFKYDTAHGIFPGKVSADDNHLYINDLKIDAHAEPDPAKLPWGEAKVDLVLECTGRFRHKDKAALHLKAGARKVLISAPGQGGVKTIVLGINDDELTNEDNIVSNASCTTNCLSPMVKVLDEAFGLNEGAFTTVHAYTADQNIQDAPHSDLRRARAAAVNIIPTSTGAADAVALVYPQIAGKLTGIAARVPVITGSFTDLTCSLNTTPTVEAVNAAMAAAAAGDMAGILEYSEAPLVSSDIVTNPHSCIFDAGMTIVVGNTVKVLGWYDNEYGYASRLADLALKVGNMS